MRCVHLGQAQGRIGRRQPQPGAYDNRETARMNSPSVDQANPYAPPQAEVSDAVGTAGATELAGRGIRLGAWFLDSLITGVVISAPLLIGMDMEALLATASDPENFLQVFSMTGIIGACVGALILIAINTYLVYKNGQSIGKKLLGIKVVRSNGTRASLLRIFFLRNVVNALPGLIPYLSYLYTLVDHLFIFGERRQCLHDKIADTIVVVA
jgi:uncharacterized RDD family membrane protein YckC